MSDLETLCNQWLVADAAMKKAKTIEMNLRKQICTPILSELIEGTVTNESIPGMIIKATAKVNRKITSPDHLAKCATAMTDEEKSVYDWTWVPKINLKNYRLHKTLFHVREQVTEKPAAPTLTIETVELDEPEQMDLIDQIEQESHEEDPYDWG